MAKRFTDTEKWEKKWYRTLSPIMKCFWEYLYTKCNYIGIWEVDFEVASFFINAKLNEAEIRKTFSKQIIEIDDGKRWLLIDFIDFQYGMLSESCNPHKPIIKKLKELGLYERVMEGLRKGIETLQEKEKEKDLEKEKEKDLEKEKEKDQVKYFEAHFNQMLPAEFFETWKKYIDHQTENGIKINRHNVINHLKAFKECFQNGISPPELLEAFQQSSHKGLYYISKNLIQEKINGNNKSSNNSKGSVKSRTDYRFNSAKAEQRLKELEEQFDK
ncbi:MAG: hypothetical protein AB1432_05620 [Bacteroidota bacterium]|jgi:hypothetical protein